MASAPPPDTTTEIPESTEPEEDGNTEPVFRSAYPPYPPMASTRAPPSVADTIVQGRDLRVKLKSTPRRQVCPPPRPAKPSHLRGPKVPNVKVSCRELRAHARCLRRHGAVLSDRLEHMAKPPRKRIIGLWRDYAYQLAPETIARLRCMLDADEPFKPEQAYQYFINTRKSRKRKSAATRVIKIKKDQRATSIDARAAWARDATVAFARGIQQRLTRPGRYQLADGMLRLSNIVLDEVCCYMRTRPPPRCCRHPKAKFLMEVSDKVAVWIDEILSESEERMLMMDFDEDEEILKANKSGTGFDDDFLNMMGDGMRSKRAYENFTGDHLDAFNILTESMDKEGHNTLLTHGPVTQTYKEGSNSLREAQSYDSLGHSEALAGHVKQQLSDTTKAHTPAKLNNAMRDVIGITSKYLAYDAQYGGERSGRKAYQQFTGDHLDAFNILTESMDKKGQDTLLSHGPVTQTYREGSNSLKKAQTFDSPGHSEALAGHVKQQLSDTTAAHTPAKLNNAMKDVIGITSKYLAYDAQHGGASGGGRAYQNFTGDHLDAFNILTESMDKKGKDTLLSHGPVTQTYKDGSKSLKEAQTFDSPGHSEALAGQVKEQLTETTKAHTPANLNNAMTDVIGITSKYLAYDAQYGERSGGRAFQNFTGDQMDAFNILTASMDKKGQEKLLAHGDVTQTYKEGSDALQDARSFESPGHSEALAGQVKQQLSDTTKAHTPAKLDKAMKEVVDITSKYLAYDAEFGEVKIKARRAYENFTGDHLDAFNILTEKMDNKGQEQLMSHGPVTQTYKEGSNSLKDAQSFDSPSHNEALAGQVKQQLSDTTKAHTPAKLDNAMKEVLDITSKYLAYDAEFGEASKKEGRKAYQNFTGDQLEAFNILTENMDKKGQDKLLPHGPVTQTYKDGSNTLKDANTFDSPGHSEALAGQVKQQLSDTTKAHTPEKLNNAMKEVLDITSKYLAYDAENLQNSITSGQKSNKFTGEHLDAFRILTDKMQDKGDTHLISHGSNTQTYKSGATDLKEADTLDVPKHSPALANQLRSELAESVKGHTPEKLDTAMKEVVDVSAKYLAHNIEHGERSPGAAFKKLTPEQQAAFKILTSSMENKGKEQLLSHGPIQQTYSGGASDLKAANTFHAPKVPQELAKQLNKNLAETAQATTPEHLQSAMNDVVDMSSKYLAKKAEQDGKNQFPGETPEDRRRREELERLRREAEAKLQREDALKILHKQLRDRGGEVFHQQTKTELTHGECSDKLKSPSIVDNTVKNSGDTARLHKKFERRLSGLVARATPAHMQDTMQDVVIESSRTLAELFVAKNYKNLAREALIAEMQKAGNELLIELDGAAESYFFAAQRLKKTQTLEGEEPCPQVVYYLRKKLEEISRCREIPRKVSPTLKEYIKEVAEYLSYRVTKPDETIEAYVSLLAEMESAGATLLIEGSILKTYKEAADYLRHLNSNEDQIRRPNATLHATTKARLKSLMANVGSHGYSSSALDGVIDNCAKLLVSYIMLQGEKTEALKVLCERMAAAGDSVLLRHGNVRKTYADGAELLKGKNTDQLQVKNADPVAARKIQIKLDNLMVDHTPAKYADLIEEVIEDATKYLAVYFFRTHKIKVCKCMKNVFVQCELWCDETFRRVSGPCCRCDGRASVQTLAEFPPERHGSPGSSRAFASRPNITVNPCPSRLTGADYGPCRALEPNCEVFCMHERGRGARRPATGSWDSPLRSPSGTPASFSPVRTFLYGARQSEHLLIERLSTSTSAGTSQSHWAHSVSNSASDAPRPPPPPSKPSQEPSTSTSYGRDHVTMLAQVITQKTPEVTVHSLSSSNTSSVQDLVTTEHMTDWNAMMVSLMWNVQAWRAWIQEIFDKAKAPFDPADGPQQWSEFQRAVAAEALQWRQYNAFSRQLTLRLDLRYRDKQARIDGFHAIMRKRAASLLNRVRGSPSSVLNVLADRPECPILRHWVKTHVILSPTRTTVKTKEYTACQTEMLNIIDRFNHWTQWIYAVVKQADLIAERPENQMALNELRWTHVRKKVDEISNDWANYNVHLQVSWEDRYRSLFGVWLPPWNQPGPVWVASACGAVPSGGVAAGVFEGEVTWVSRTPRGGRVLPAALRPSLHCCVLYTDGAVHYYAKYQVLCNADVRWCACRAGRVPARALQISPGVCAGRVLYRGSHLLGPVLAPHYRCHVVIFGRPFAFNCFEILVSNEENS